MNEVALGSLVQMFFILLESGYYSLICFAGTVAMLVPSLHVVAHIFN